MPFLLTLVAILFCLSLPAQISQPLRYEHDHKSSDHEFIVVSVEDKGLMLVRDTEKYEGSKKVWEIITLDTLLNESWTAKIEIDKRMVILGHDFRNGNVYLIYKEPDAVSNNLNLVEVLLKERTVRQHEFKPQVNIHFTHFSILLNVAIFAGYISNAPTLLMFDFSTEIARVVPGGYQAGGQLLDVRTNTNETFNTVMTERIPGGGKRMVVRTYDISGALLLEDIVPFDNGKIILEAMTSTLVRDELVAVGTWSYSGGKEPSGIFSVMIDPNKDHSINYYDFAQFDHFLDYLKPQRISRIKSRAQKQRDAGRQVSFRAYVNTVRVEEYKNGFILLAEVYQPSINYYNTRYRGPYNTPYYNGANNPYNYYSSPYSFNTLPGRYYYSPDPNALYGNGLNSSVSTSEVQMFHSSLVFFDEQGKLRSDLGLKYPEIKRSDKEQLADFLPMENHLIMICRQEKDILTQITEQDGSMKEERIKTALKKSTETIDSEHHEDSAVRFWYGRSFYAYGYQTIRDNELRSTRDVFYINKMVVD